MPNKDGGKVVSAPAAGANDPLIGSVSTTSGRTSDKMGKPAVKNTTAKVSWNGVEIMGGGDLESPMEELLGSLTSGGVEGAVRSSARVIKKMKLDSAPIPTPEPTVQSQRKDSIKEGEKVADEVNTKLPGDKQSKITKCRMPKALWSSNEKNLFFEALNEYGKDFDSITAYICNKMKRKGVPDSSTKAKHQVSTFYYRTWQKVSKHLKFDDDVRKVVQELYALINYGELRKRMEGGISSGKLGRRLGELVKRGVVAVRWRGRTLRVRTPVCRALRTLNQLHEWEEQLRLPVRVIIQLNARDAEAWRVVQGAAHNPRVLAPASPSLRLQLLLHLLQRRWTAPLTKELIPNLHEKDSFSCFNSLDCQISTLLNPSAQTALKLDNQEALNNMATSTTDKISPETGNSSKEPKLNEPLSCKVEDGAEDGGKNNNNVPNFINGNDINSEDSTHKTGKRLDADGKVDDAKNSKGTSHHLEAVAGQKDRCYLHVGPKPGLTFSLPTVSVGEHLTSQRICFNSYQERLRNNTLVSGLQNGAGFKGGGRFKNQKRSRKDSGDVGTAEGGKETKKGKSENENCDIKTDLLSIDETANDGMDIMDFKIIDHDDKEKDFLSELDEDLECEGEEARHTSKNKVPDKPKKEVQKSGTLTTSITDSPEDGKAVVSAAVTTTTQVAVITSTANNGLKTWNKDVLLQQIKKGWSVTDAGDLTIGDLYLMFGSESKLDLEFWWCEPSPPMQQRIKASPPSASIAASDAAGSSIDSTNGTASKVETDKEGADNDRDMVDGLLMSPTHTSQDSNDTEKDMVSPDHRQNHVSEDPSVNTAYPLVSKIVNCLPTLTHYSPPGHNDSRSPEQKDSTPLVVPSRERIVNIGSRLKKLLSLARLYDAKGTKTGCSCGHFCASSRLKFRSLPMSRDDTLTRPTTEYPWQRGNLSSSQEGIHFRTPLPKVAVRTNPTIANVDIGLDKLPPWTKRGGRPRQNSVIPQRFNILPRPVIQNVTSLTRAPVTVNTTSSTTVSSNSPTATYKGLPKLRPKPCVVTIRPSLTVERTPAAVSSPAANPADIKQEAIALETANKSAVSSTTTGQIIESDIKNEFLISAKPTETGTTSKWSEVVKQEMTDVTPNLANLLDISLPSNICDDSSIGIALKEHRTDGVDKHGNFTGLLPAESMSMSPSRLLKENDDQWLESEVHNFSLSSFLGHLEGPHGTNSVSKLGKPDEDSNVVEAPLHCLMNDSIDYMAKFQDLANRVSAEATK